MRPLYEITADLIALDAVLDEFEGDLSKAGPNVEAWLTEVEGEEAAKLDGYVNLMKSLEMESAAARAEAEQFLCKAKARTDKFEYLKAMLAGHLRATGKSKVKTAGGRTLSIVGNGGHRPVIVDVTDPMALQERFREVEVSISKEKIREALTEGEDLPFARFGDRGTHLRIA